MNKVTTACVLLAMLSACSSEEPANTDASTSSEAASASGSQTNNGQSSSGNAKVSAAALSEASIDYEAALGRVPAVVTEPGPCPFLSDETLKATVKSSFELIRRAVSNTQCRWSYNAGFSVKVTVEPVDESTPAAEQRYNIGVDSQLDPQSGPGHNAQLLSDTAFGRPVPFGYGFELNDKAVFIRVTGLKTDLTRLRTAADEIAAKLPSAPTIEPQQRSESVVFEPCSVWNAATLQSLMGLSAQQTLSARASGNSCIYEAYGDGTNMGMQLTVRFGELDAKYHAKAVARGDDDVAGFDFPVSSAIEESSFGTYTKLTGYVAGGGIEIFLLDKGNAKHIELTKKLLGNIAARI